MTKREREFRMKLLAISDGLCACGCGTPVSVDSGELDHFHGRAKAEESESACWVLSPQCHQRKTLNRPDAEYWLRVFIHYCDVHGFDASAARKKLAS